MSWIWAFLRRNYSDRCETGLAVPAKAVCEGGGSWQVALPIHGAAVATRAEGPKGCGWAWEVQTDVPKWVNRRGNAAIGKRKRNKPDNSNWFCCCCEERTTMSSLGSNLHSPQMNVCLNPVEDGACVRASLIPHILLGSFAILLNIASLKNQLWLWRTLAEASCVAINVYRAQADRYYLHLPDAWKSSNGRCIYSINKGWLCSKSLYSLESYIVRRKFCKF